MHVTHAFSNIDFCKFSDHGEGCFRVLTRVSLGLVHHVTVSRNINARGVQNYMYISADMRKGTSSYVQPSCRIRSSALCLYLPLVRLSLPSMVTCKIGTIFPWAGSNIDTITRGVLKGAQQLSACFFFFHLGDCRLSDYNSATVTMRHYEPYPPCVGNTISYLLPSTGLVLCFWNSWGQIWKWDYPRTIDFFR